MWCDYFDIAARACLFTKVSLFVWMNELEVETSTSELTLSSVSTANQSNVIRPDQFSMLDDNNIFNNGININININNNASINSTSTRPVWCHQLMMAPRPVFTVQCSEINSTSCTNILRGLPISTQFLYFQGKGRGGILIRFLSIWFYLVQSSDQKKSFGPKYRFFETCEPNGQ